MAGNDKLTEQTLVRAFIPPEQNLFDEEGMMESFIRQVAFESPICMCFKTDQVEKERIRKFFETVFRNTSSKGP